MKTCKVEDCDRPVLSKGYCNAHYIRSRNGSDMNAPILERREGCLVENCDKKHRVNGYCSTHCQGYKRGVRRKELVEHLGAKCSMCQNEFPYYVYDFHHEDPSQKDFEVSDRVAGYTLDILYKEVDKCVLLCSNCHRIRHYIMKEVKYG